MLAFDAFDLPADEVRDRFDRAVRCGHPHWLWPETDAARWCDALEQIERVTRQILVGGRGSDVLDGSGSDFSVAAFTSGMGPLLGYWASMGLLPASQAILDVVELHYRHNSIRQSAMGMRAIEFVDALAANSVGVTVLKGMQTAFAYFPASGARPMSDIDVLIDLADQKVAADVLRGLGYELERVSTHPPEQCWRMRGTAKLPRTLQTTHCDDPWSIDLHTGLNRSYSAGARPIELDKLLDGNSLEPWALSPRASALSPVAMAIHLACHAGCGHDSLTMLRLTELILVTRSGLQTARFSWDSFVAQADQGNMLPSAYPALRLADALCPGAIPEDVVREAEKRVPKAVGRIVQRMRPANAHRVLRCSLEERFMWTRSKRALARQVANEIFMPATPMKYLSEIYRARMWRLMRGTLGLNLADLF